MTPKKDKDYSIDDELDAFLSSKNKKDDVKEAAAPKQEEQKPVSKPVYQEPVKPAADPAPEKANPKGDFLSSLVDDKRPDSFKEEEVVRIERKPFKPSRGLIIGAVVALLAVLALVYFLFFMPNMTMPEFVGKTTTEVQTWMRQNTISSTDIIVVEEYNFDYPAGQVVSQTMPENKRFRKGEKITIVVSKGANPDEAVLFPDVKSMSYSELTQWRDTNKLLNMKISQIYHDTIENGQVISYSLGNNVTETEFKRGSSITVTVSRGKQPVQSVSIQDFTGKTQVEAETWANTNKMKLDVKESFTSDATKAGKIASQSPNSGSADQGSTVTIYVYKNAATMSNLEGLTETEARAWCSSNGVQCTFVEQYHDTVLPNRVVSQSVKAGRIVEGTTPVTVHVSIGQVDILDFTGSSISQLRSWVEDKNSKLAGLNLSEESVVITDPSTQKVGDIIEYTFPTHDRRYGYLKYGEVITVKFYVSDGAIDPNTGSSGTNP